MNNAFFHVTIRNQPTPSDVAQLFQAIRLGDLKKTKELLASGININSVDIHGIKPLVWATMCWNNVQYFQSMGISNLYEVRMHNRIEIAEQLITAVLLENMDADKHYYFCEESEFLLWDNCKSKIEKETEALANITFNTFSLWALYKEKDVDILATMSRNEAVKNLLAEPNFKEKYPCFGAEIQANFQKGLARAKMLDTALNSLVTYNRGPKLLPAECWEKVLKNLDRDDLKNVTKSIFFKEVSSATSAWKRISSFVFRTH